MKRYVLAVMLAMASTAALADRVVSGKTFAGDRYAGESRGAACQSAKDRARSVKLFDEVVKRYSDCECDQNRDGEWVCTVDAKLERSGGKRRVESARTDPGDRFALRDRASACQSAKQQARRNKVSGEQVEGFSDCECGQDRDDEWSCSVNVLLEKE